MENYRRAEALERILEESHIPVLPALTVGGRKMQELDGQFFYLYQWYEGRCLRPREIREAHCVKTGGLLARIHGLDRRQEGYIHIDWDYYMGQLSEKNRELCSLLKDNRSLLYETQERGNWARNKLPPDMAICHNDMDSKNVLWLGTDCRIIDLECLAYDSPFLELYETALCWSGFERIDFGHGSAALSKRISCQKYG